MRVRVPPGPHMKELDTVRLKRDVMVTLTLPEGYTGTIVVDLPSESAPLLECTTPDGRSFLVRVDRSDLEVVPDGA
jgi:hypothetical protein